MLLNMLLNTFKYESGEQVLNYEDYKDMTTVDLANHCRNYAVENLEKILEYNDCRRKVKEN